LKEFDFRNRSEKHFETGYNIGYAARTGVESRRNDRKTAAAIEGTKGLHSAIAGLWNQAIERAAQGPCLRTKRIQEIRATVRQIASQNQIPFGEPVAEGRFHACQGPAPLAKIGDHGIAKVTIFQGISNQSNFARRFLHPLRDGLNHGYGAAEGKKRFVPAHARTPAAGQDVADHTHADRIHSGMISFKIVSLVISKVRLGLVGAVLGSCAGPILAGGEPARTTLVVKSDSHSGRLVRSVAIDARPMHSVEPDPPVSVAAEPEPPATSLIEMIDRIAANNEVEALLVHSVIKAESNYNPLAISPKGAQGMMQLIPSTARRFGVANSFNAQQNIEGGVKYLKFLMDLFHSDYVKVIAAYNAGEAAVAKYGGIPPYAETRNYVNQVGRNLVNARKAAEHKTASIPAADTNAETIHTIQSVIAADGRIYYKSQ
jgi:Transglycosylase SLT domain